MHRNRSSALLFFTCLIPVCMGAPGGRCARHLQIYSPDGPRHDLRGIRAGCQGNVGPRWVSLAQDYRNVVNSNQCTCSEEAFPQGGLRGRPRNRNHKNLPKRVVCCSCVSENSHQAWQELGRPMLTRQPALSLHTIHSDSWTSSRTAADISLISLQHQIVGVNTLVRS